MHNRHNIGISAAAVLMALLCLAGCKAKPQETTVVYAEIVGCYRETDESANPMHTRYTVDFIWRNEVYKAEGAKSYYRALNYLYGQAWIRVVMDNGEIKEVVEVCE